MDIDRIKQLIELVEQSNVQELELTEGSESIRIQRRQDPATQYVATAPIAATPLPQQLETTNQKTAKDAHGARNQSHESEDFTGHIVRAPMVGTFYKAPSPNSAAFTEVGQYVKSGEVLGIIEAMKMMNQIEADKSGTIEAILVENGEPVEFDQPMFTIV